ncbi:MAG: hypothetical protein CMN77_07440 [Spirochaetaceae bacterium]|nr:hypothetical protein [Spirochaetaceae bacterium]|tara:strand:+ start:16519 stop:17625 length:1107 start_codon:yes stop_codon:yes gene_type:complete
MPAATRSIEELVRKTFFPGSALLLLLLTGCLGSPYRSYSDLFSRHPANRVENWQASLQARTQQNELPRDFIQPATELPLQYGIDMNALDEFAPPRPAYPEKQELEDMHNQLKLVLRSQPELKRFLIKRVAGIYLVHDLGSSGLTGFIYDSSGDAVAGFILLDLDRIQMSAEDMINLREKSIIQNANELPAFWGYRLSCGGLPCPGTVSGAIYLLFHESAHIATEVYGLLPSLRTTPEDYRASRGELPSPFNRFWQDPWNSKFQYPFAGKLRFYSSNPELSREQHSRGVDRAMQDGFPGLYATVDAWEHAAEVVAYSMLRRQLEFRRSADSRRVLDLNSVPGYARFIQSLKEKMRKDPGLQPDPGDVSN